jgi:hypothetical protein
MLYYIVRTYCSDTMQLDASKIDSIGRKRAHKTTAPEGHVSRIVKYSTRNDSEALRALSDRTLHTAELGCGTQRKQKWRVGMCRRSRGSW